MGLCDRDGCSGHADATVYVAAEADDERRPDRLEHEECCRSHALEAQMYGSPPAAVTWTGDVGVDLQQ